MKKMTIKIDDLHQKSEQIERKIKTNLVREINFSIQNKIIDFLEIIQSLIVIMLCFSLLGVMLMKMKELFTSLISPLNLQLVTLDILFVLILLEIFRFLIIYLEKKEISVGVAVEISIVSILREVILRGVMEISNCQIWSICGILLVLGIIMIIPSIEMILTKKMATSSYLPDKNQGKIDYLVRGNPIAFFENSVASQSAEAIQIDEIRGRQK